jgi:hypothetical protein
VDSIARRLLEHRSDALLDSCRDFGVRRPFFHGIHHIKVSPHRRFPPFTSGASPHCASGSAHAASNQLCKTLGAWQLLRRHRARFARLSRRRSEARRRRRVRRPRPRAPAPLRADEGKRQKCRRDPTDRTDCDARSSGRFERTLIVEANRRICHKFDSACSRWAFVPEPLG